MKLTDTQLVILSAASQREDRGVELPPNLKGGAAKQVVSKLLGQGLLEEVPAGDSLPAWRGHDHEGPIALRVTPAGLTAIGVGVSASSLTADQSPKSAARSRGVRRKPKQQGPRAKPLKRVRSDSKQAQVLAMLRRAGGASIAAIMAKTGWQAHSVRGFLAGTVRTKLGLNLVSEKVGEKRVYRITG